MATEIITKEQRYRIVKGVMLPMLKRLPPTKRPFERKARDKVIELYERDEPAESSEWVSAKADAADAATYAATRAATRAAVDAAAYAADYAAGAAARVGADATLEWCNLARDLIAACAAEGISLRVPSLDSMTLAAIKAKPQSFNMYSWHSPCGTTHCRAGYYATWLGETGRALEAIFGTKLLGFAVFLATYPDAALPNFHCDNDEAIESMRVTAALDDMEASNGN